MQKLVLITAALAASLGLAACDHKAKSEVKTDTTTTVTTPSDSSTSASDSASAASDAASMPTVGSLPEGSTSETKTTVDKKESNK